LSAIRRNHYRGISAGYGLAPAMTGAKPSSVAPAWLETTNFRQVTEIISKKASGHFTKSLIILAYFVWPESPEMQ
jgi:hypothetical protein